MNNKILFNGKEYNSPEEMPADVHQMYVQMMGLFADKNQDGIPDMFQQGGENVFQAETPATVSMAQTFVVDGKVYNSLDELPSDMRRQYEEKMAAFDQNRDGVPDVLEGFLQGGSVGMPQQQGNVGTAVSPTPDTPYTVTTDSTSSKMVAAGAIIFLLILVIVVLAIYLTMT